MTGGGVRTVQTVRIDAALPGLAISFCSESGCSTLLVG